MPCYLTSDNTSCDNVMHHSYVIFYCPSKEKEKEKEELN